MILHGRHLIIKVGGVDIAAAKSCTINVQAEQIEVSGPTSGEWEEFRNGRKKWTVNCNHLITNIAHNAQLVGTKVSLTCCIEGADGLLFNGFVNNPTLESGSLSNPSVIAWDKTRKKFLAGLTHPQYSTLFYESWAGDTQYTSPSDYQAFVCLSDNSVYTYLNGDLTAEKMAGDANAESWHVSGAVGSLAQGQFTFRGTGPLTPAAIPTTT